MSKIVNATENLLKKMLQDATNAAIAAGELPQAEIAEFIV